jgi:putative endonuclease
LDVGVTNDVISRVLRHRDGSGSAFTKRYRVTRLVWFEAHETVAAAIQRETSLKRWKRDLKIELINKNNPERRDLFGELGE